LKDVPAMKQKLTKKLFITHFGALQKKFSLYFKDINVSRFEWVRNPYAAINISGLMTYEQEQFK